MSVIGRVDDGDSRWYIDPLDGRQFESVTRILNATAAKPWLTPWSAKLAAEAAVDNIGFLRQVLAMPAPDGGREAAVEWLKGAARRRREMKADMGVYTHDVIEALILDTPIPSPPEHLVGVVIDGEVLDLDAIVDGFLAFNEDFAPEWLLAEATVASPEHGYAGTLDFVARFPRLGGRLGGVDTKTGVVLDKEMNAQLAAYRNCTEIWLNDLGDRAPMPRWDFAAILHIRTSYARGYKLLEQPADAKAFQWFLDCREVVADAEAAPPVRGRPLYPARADGTQPPMLVEDHPVLAQFAKPLAAAGADDVEMVSCLSVAALLALPGIGEVSVLAIAAALAAIGLHLDGAQPCVGAGAFASPRRKGRKVVADCPECGAEVSAAKDGTVRFHTRVGAEVAA